MSDILFIKTSSLGDVIHHMPAITEARRHRPRARFAWVVEEAFAPLVALHPAVDEVIAVASRRWRRQLHRLATWREVQGFVMTLRARTYQEIIDVQGLGRTAVIAKLARGRRHGYDLSSVRERPAAGFYDVTHRIDPGLHAIARNRMLTARALGYELELAAAPNADLSPDFGLDRNGVAGGASIRLAPAPYGILLHATARPDKEWTERNWIETGQMLGGRGLELVLPGGTQGERDRGARIADALENARVPERAPIDEVARLIARAAFVIGVDTGLLHLAAALGVPAVGIFVGSEPVLTGPLGRGPIAILGRNGVMPSPQEVVAALERLVR